MDQSMTPAEERALINDTTEIVREMSVDALIGSFNSVLVHASFIRRVGGDILECGDAAAIEFTILRNELELRGVIRFH